MQTLLGESSIVVERETQVPLRGQLRRGDAEAVEKLVAETGVFNLAEVAVAKSLIGDAPAGEYLFLFADGAGALDGYVCFGPIAGTDRRYELYWLAVSPRAARRGLGRRLLKGCEDAVRAAGGTHIFAETSTLPSYAPAHALYLDCGYALQANVPDYHADGDGMLIFSKRL
ncbi:MAG TPA: GNAT family N-acetyltransferase [Rhizomicrobium sp.]|nr:GNAT family N-acetyltransferase [Rhizomicrobium sp.]